MSQSFFRTRRLIKSDNFLLSTWFLIVTMLILVLWFLWFFLYDVELYQVTPKAHIEVGTSLITIAAPIDGTIKDIKIENEQKVKKDDALITFEDQTIKLSLKEIKARLNKAEADAKFAEEEFTRWQKLYDSKLLPEIDLLRSKASMIGLKNEVKALQAKKELLIFELKKHKLTAPIAGTIGSVRELRQGGLVKKGDTLGSIIPTGSHKIIAYFEPAMAIGRIKAKQKARMKLDGFSWTQYGMLQASVKNVANEVIQQGIKVELNVDEKQNANIPYQHGLTGTVEILIGHQTPVQLVLSKIGKLFSSQKTKTN